MTIFESLINIVSIPFAFRLRGNINSDLCTNDYVQSTGVQPMLYGIMNSSLGFTVAAGAASTILFATILIVALDRSKEGVEGRRLLVLKLLFMVLSGGMLISNWLFWAAFLKLSKDTYCPAGIVVTGVMWGVSYVINRLMRPLLGGSGQ